MVHSFTIRVDLLSENDYSTLNIYMEDEGFTKTMTTYKGSKVLLPTGEYDIKGNYTQEQVMKRVNDAADKLKIRYCVLITKSAGRITFGLPEVG